MKRIFQHPPESAESLSGKKYWRSLGQLEDTPEFRGWLEKEFPAGASELEGDTVSRRSFLKLMGASTALAGLSLSGCRRPEKHLVPFTRGVEWSIPGKALFFATAMPTRRGAAPLVVTTYDGRPTKIEGNPLHPVSKGRTDTFSQASVLDLYDPDRARFFFTNSVKTDSAAFEKALDGLLADAGDGSGLAFLLETNNSPTRERLRREIEKRFPKAFWAVYEPCGSQFAEQAAGVAFGEGVTPAPMLDKADVILALDADFLGCDVGNLEGIRGFSARRKVDGPESKMNRLYVVENRYTVTGGIADHRLRLPASQIGAFALALATELGVSTKDAALQGLLKDSEASPFKFNADWVKYCAEDLASAKGRSLVLVGAQQPAAVQVLVAALNSALGNLGTTIMGRAATEAPAKTISELASVVREKQVRTLFIVGGNPVYNAPADLDWRSLQGSVDTVVRLGASEDETSATAGWNVPLAHYLETWGDALATDGSYLAVQPMILPLFNGWSELDLLAKVAGRPKPEGPELIQETFRDLAKPADFDAAWAEFLRNGFVTNSAAKPAPLAFNGTSSATFIGENSATPALAEGAYEVVFVADSKMDDGRFNNNGWLQEIPDPITKLTWDNAALISPGSAKKLGVATGDMIEVSIEKRALTLPALVAPGHADGSITIPLGYGRTVTGRVGRGCGFNAYPLRTSTQPYFVVGATARSAGSKYALAITQEHGALEGRGADLTREATLEEFRERPAFAKTSGMDAHIPKNVSLYKNPALNDIHAWGMTVDMSACTGCSACMVACQSENNIPIVGKEQVINGREMHWIRADRYFASTDANDPEPEMVSQPMMCQHCENAPCETVCPVNATVHSEDGLNVMAYNRCIGTRYCANNCPFKVRRFNFFDYNRRDVLGREKGKPFSGVYKWNLIAEKGTPDTVKMQKNPNVTVRMRGVMEKCTFCVQRIQEAKVATKVAARDSDDVRIPANSFTVACAQACPTDAITFGDFNNPDSDVAKLKNKERGYRLLEYLNVNTRVYYLARIRNPNMKMPGAEKIGAAMKSAHGHESHEVANPAGGHS